MDVYNSYCYRGDKYYFDGCVKFLQLGSLQYYFDGHVICVEIVKSYTNLAHIYVHMCGVCVTFAFNKETVPICNAHLLHIWKGECCYD